MTNKGSSVSPHGLSGILERVGVGQVRTLDALFLLQPLRKLIA